MSALQGGSAGGGFALAGSDTTERTTQSATSVTLSTITADIAQGQYFRIVGQARKDDGGSGHDAALGLTLNATAVFTATVAGGGGFWECTATDRAENGYFVWDGYGATTNYATAIAIRYETRTAAGARAAVGVYPSRALTNALPVAAVTSVLITGLVAHTDLTLSLDQVFVYTGATS
jgi:hypothetical protein